MRIGIVGLSHETNTFAIEKNDTMDCVRARRGEDVLGGARSKSFMGGFVEAAQRDDVELVPIVAIGFAHGGIIGREVFEQCRTMIIEGLKEREPLDGVYFAFHGAMVAEDPYTDAEGEAARAVKEALGDVPMVATYDFHAIMSRWENENVVPFPNNTNPHIDGYERGMEAAENLLRMLDGTLNPVTRRVFVPIIGPNIGQSTWSQIPADEEKLLLYRLNEKRKELEEHMAPKAADAYIKDWNDHHESRDPRGDKYRPR